MSIKLIWTGMALLLAVNPVLALVGLKGSTVIVSVGACVMLLGTVLMWLDR